MHRWNAGELKSVCPVYALDLPSRSGSRAGCTMPRYFGVCTRFLSDSPASEHGDIKEGRICDEKIGFSHEYGPRCGWLRN